MKFKDFMIEEVESTSSRGTYAGIKYPEDLCYQIVNKANTLGIPNVIDMKDIHTTLLYSRNFLDDYLAPNTEIEVQYKATPEKFEVFNDKILVLVLKSEDLINRHNYLMSIHNATYDFPEYIPHITLSYDIGDFDISNIDISEFSDFDYIGVIEYSKELDLNKTYK